MSRRAACFPYMDSLGHAGRGLVAARALREAGWDVVAGGEGIGASFFRAEGFRVEPFATPPHARLGGWFGHYLPGLPFVHAVNPTPEPAPPYMLEDLVAAAVALLRRLEPDVLLTDGAPWMWLAAKVAGFPHAAIIGWTWTRAFASDPSLPFPDPAARHRLLDAPPSPFDRVAEHLGIQPPPGPLEALGGDLCLIAEDLRLLPTALPAGMVGVGALAWDPGGRVDDAAPWALVSTGSSPSPSLRQAVARWGLPGEVKWMGDVRGADRPVQPGAALVRGARMVICHGGSQTLYQAAYAGRPALALPTHWEQAWNAELFQRAGLAVRLDPDAPEAADRWAHFVEDPEGACPNRWPAQEIGAAGIAAGRRLAAAIDLWLGSWGRDPGIVERLVPGLNRAWDGSSPALRQHLLRYHLARAFVRPGMRVLDLACGAGYGSHLLQQAGAEVVGVDRDAVVLGWARSRYPDVSFVCAQAEDLPFADASFDAAVVLETLEHLPDPAALLGHLRRLLRPPALLIVSTPVVPSRHLDPWHLHDLTEAGLVAMLHDAGFAVWDHLVQDATYACLVATCGPPPAVYWPGDPP